ncbi:MAG: hypothetical protein ACOCXJ_01805 [Planctomycetota bacterium]
MRRLYGLMVLVLALSCAPLAAAVTLWPEPTSLLPVHGWRESVVNYRGQTAPDPSGLSASYQRLRADGSVDPEGAQSLQLHLLATNNGQQLRLVPPRTWRPQAGAWYRVDVQESGAETLPGPWIVRCSQEDDGGQPPQLEILTAIEADPEDTTTVDPAHLSAWLPDDAAVRARLLSLPSAGSLKRAGVVLDVDDRFPLTALSDGLLVYQNDDGERRSDGFLVQLEAVDTGHAGPPFWWPIRIGTGTSRILQLKIGSGSVRFDERHRIDDPVEPVLIVASEAEGLSYDADPEQLPTQVDPELRVEFKNGARPGDELRLMQQPGLRLDGALLLVDDDARWRIVDAQDGLDGRPLVLRAAGDWTDGAQARAIMLADLDRCLRALGFANARRDLQTEVQTIRIQVGDGAGNFVTAIRELDVVARAHPPEALGIAGDGRLLLNVRMRSRSIELLASDPEGGPIRFQIDPARSGRLGSAQMIAEDHLQYTCDPRLAADGGRDEVAVLVSDDEGNQERLLVPVLISAADDTVPQLLSPPVLQLAPGASAGVRIGNVRDPARLRVALVPPIAGLELEPEDAAAPGYYRLRFTADGHPEGILLTHLACTDDAGGSVAWVPLTICVPQLLEADQ